MKNYFITSTVSSVNVIDCNQVEKKLKCKLTRITLSGNLVSFCVADPAMVVYFYERFISDLMDLI